MFCRHALALNKFKRLRRKLRNILSGLRTTPSYLVIGAQKAGTSSLYQTLNEHPQLIPAREKEVHFFDLNYPKGIAWYHDHFPLSTGKNQQTGEASPYYMYHPLAAERVCNYNPAMKLIALLRNPIDRAYSHYHHIRGYGLEDLTSFEAAIEAEHLRLEGLDQELRSGNQEVSLRHRHWSYLSRGCYAQQLNTWLAHFPREQLLLLTSESLFDQPDESLQSCFEFLGLDEFKVQQLPQLLKQDYTPMKSETRAALRSYFAKDVDELRAQFNVGKSWDI